MRYKTYQLLLINQIWEQVTSMVDCASEQLSTGAATVKLNPTKVLDKHSQSNTENTEWGKMTVNYMQPHKVHNIYRGQPKNNQQPKTHKCVMSHTSMHQQKALQIVRIVSQMSLDALEVM